MLTGAGIRGAPAARPQPHPAARVRGPAPVRRGRRDDHRQPQPARATTATSSTWATARRSCRRWTPRSRPRSAAWARCPAIPLGPPDSPLITRHGDEIAQAYLDAILAASPGVPRSRRRGPDLRVVYTPLHGVAGPLMLRAIDRAGYPAPHVVAAQAEPDPDFPTVPFPNPEEPGALDLALADARELDADLVLASDPDGDRLAVAVPDPGGRRRLADAHRGPGRRAARRVRARRCEPGSRPGVGAEASDRPSRPETRRGSAARGAAGRLDRGLLAAVQDRRRGRRAVRGDADRVQVDRPGRG